MRRRPVLFALGLLACATVAQAQTAPIPLPERIQKAGKIVIATYPNYPPLTFRDPATNQRLVIGDLNNNGTPADAADIMASAGFTALDDEVSQNTMTMWTNFAKTGDPSVTGLIDWPAYTTTNDAYVELGATPAARTGLSALFP